MSTHGLGVIGRYRLLQKLGDGGMADLFLAMLDGPEGFQKPVVIKQLRPELADQECYRQMLSEEARVMACLSHPHVLAALDFGVESGQPFLVLEHVEGVDLAKLLAVDGPLPPELVRHVGLCLLRALEHVHGLRDADGAPLGLVHRDISPSNVLLSRTGDIKLGDFGIAKGARSPARTRPNQVRGKLRYMSPEHLQGERLDGRSDLFALGLLLYEAAMGHSPFLANTEAELLLAVRAGRLKAMGPLRDTVGEAFSGLIARALRAVPEERFSSASEMIAALLALELGREAEQPWRISERVSKLSTDPASERFALAPVARSMLSHLLESTRAFTRAVPIEEP